MKRMLEFRTIAYDSNHILPGVSSYSYFEDNVIQTEESVTTNPESAIVRWLFYNELIRCAIIEAFVGSVNDNVFGLEVKQPLITEPRKKPGDIDILLCDKHMPNKAVAIECKRVKVVVQQDGKQKVNKIQEIGVGITQANGLQSMGFHQSYLLLIVVVDARLKMAEGNIFFKYENQKETSAVYEVPMDASLHNDVGVAYIEIIQPTGKGINEMGQVGICVDKRAVQLEQPARLSGKVRDYIHSITT